MTAVSLDSLSKTLTIDTIDFAAFAGHKAIIIVAME